MTAWDELANHPTCTLRPTSERKVHCARHDVSSHSLPLSASVVPSQGGAPDGPSPPSDTRVEVTPSRWARS